MHLTIRGSERVKECIFMAAFSQDKIRRVVSEEYWSMDESLNQPSRVKEDGSMVCKLL